MRFPVVVFGIEPKTTRASVTSDYGAAAYECTYSGLVSSLMKVGVSSIYMVHEHAQCICCVSPWRAQVLAAQGQRRARWEGDLGARRVTLSGLAWPV